MSFPMPSEPEPFTNGLDPRRPPAAIPWIERKLRVGHETLRVAERGHRGTPLLLINGIGAHIDMWAPFERLLGDRRLIACDLPGCGESTLSAVPRRMRGLADLVSELIDVLGYGEVDALGYSFGGALAQELAHRFPDRVRRLILCATSPGIISVPPKPLPALFLLTPARYYHPVFFRFMMPRIVGGRTAQDSRALDEQIDTRLAHPPALLGYLYQLLAAAGWTSMHYLHRLPQPTLVVAGDDDRAIPLANARLLAHRIPNARLHVVIGGGHAFLLDEPESVVGEIEAFLDRP
jgi:poly(3-hydroxyoctanoate) depolymerase